jgi:hypothetical protein
MSDAGGCSIVDARFSIRHSAILTLPFPILLLSPPNTPPCSASGSSSASRIGEYQTCDVRKKGASPDGGRERLERLPGYLVMEWHYARAARTLRPWRGSKDFKLSVCARSVWTHAIRNRAFRPSVHLHYGEITHGFLVLFRTGLMAIRRHCTWSQPRCLRKYP